MKSRSLAIIAAIGLLLGIVIGSCAKRKEISKGSTANGTGLSGDTPSPAEAIGTSAVPQIAPGDLNIPAGALSMTSEASSPSTASISIDVDSNQIGQGLKLEGGSTTDISPVFLMWKACTTDGKTCYSNDFIKSYDFNIANITGLPKGLLKVQAKLCVDDLKFITGAEKKSMKNQCSNTAPCYCGPETSQQFMNDVDSANASPEYVTAAQTYFTEQQKLISIAQDYINQATKFVANASAADANNSIVQYAQNIAGFSSTELAMYSENFGDYLVQVAQASQQQSGGTDTASGGLGLANSSRSSSTTKANFKLIKMNVKTLLKDADENMKYRLVNGMTNAGDSGSCLDTYSGPYPENRGFLEDCAKNTSGSFWHLIKTADSTYRLTNENTGNTMCLGDGVDGNSFTTMFECSDTKNSELVWKLIPVPRRGGDVFQLAMGGSPQKCLSISTASSVMTAFVDDCSKDTTASIWGASLADANVSMTASIAAGASGDQHNFSSASLGENIGGIYMMYIGAAALVGGVAAALYFGLEAYGVTSRSEVGKLAKEDRAIKAARREMLLEVEKEKFDATKYNSAREKYFKLLDKKEKRLEEKLANNKDAREKKLNDKKTTDDQKNKLNQAQEAEVKKITTIQGGIKTEKSNHPTSDEIKRVSTGRSEQEAHVARKIHANEERKKSPKLGGIEKQGMNAKKSKILAAGSALTAMLGVGVLVGGAILSGAIPMGLTSTGGDFKATMQTMETKLYNQAQVVQAAADKLDQLQTAADGTATTP